MHSIYALSIFAATAAAFQLPFFPPGPGGPPGRGPWGPGPDGPGGAVGPVVPPSWDYKNRIILIRHAEKPGRGGFGLSERGKERAECLRTVFGQESEFDFGMVFAAPRDEATQDQERTWMTVKPVATDLGLDIVTACANEQPACIAAKVEEWAKSNHKDILISWKHRDLLGIARGLGANTTAAYPDDRFDIMWIIDGHQIVEKRSEHCPVLDENRPLLEDKLIEL